MVVSYLHTSRIEDRMPIGRHYKKGKLVSEEYFELREPQKSLDDRETNGTPPKADTHCVTQPHAIPVYGNK
jgi:hypothetical protein